MNILLLYATYSSGTDIASQTVNDILSQKHKVTRKLVWDYEGKEGQPHQDFINFILNCANKTFENKSFAVFGLGDSSYAHFCGGVDELNSFVNKIKGKLIIDSLKIDGFYFNQADNLEKITSWTNDLMNKIQ